MSFKVGDRVRVVHSPYYGVDWQAGRELEITEEYPQGSGWDYKAKPVERLDPAGFNTLSFNTKHLKLVQPESKFKVGDRVRITDSLYHNPEHQKGCEGVVEATYGDPVHAYGVRAGNGCLLAHTERDLELVTTTNQKGTNTMNIAMITNSTGLTVVLGSDVHTIAKDHPNFKAIQDAYAEGRSEDIETLISVRKTIEAFSDGNIRVVDGALFYGDREVKTGLAKRIIQLTQEGRESFASTLMAFMENLMQNPSYRAVEGLYEWLERSNLPLTPDGHFIAWKMIRDDYKDIYSGKFDNSVGQVVEVPRNAVDEDPDRTCSYGLHFCSNEYLDSGYSRGGRTVMVKINPRDVGAFPHDYGISKGRCCRYEVIEEVTMDQAKTMFTDTPTAVYRGGTKVVERLETTNTDRAEIILVFKDGSKQRTKNRLGDTTSFEQRGNVVTLLPSERTITID